MPWYRWNFHSILFLCLCFFVFSYIFLCEFSWYQFKISKRIQTKPQIGWMVRNNNKNLIDPIQNFNRKLYGIFIAIKTHTHALVINYKSHIVSVGELNFPITKPLLRYLALATVWSELPWYSSFAITISLELIGRSYFARVS